MECNKDEAVKAKKIAEQKLTEKDIAGAQKFALKAKSMFPGLDGISQFLEIINVYVAHERKKTNGEVDFYGVLSVEPSADDQTIRKHYTRLALALHPDKNQSVGADGAFNIISEARGLLSDRTKRMMYDNKNGSSASGVKLLTAKAGMSTLKTDAGFVPDSVSTCSKADRLVKRRRLARSSKELYDLETRNLLENKARMDILAFLSEREKEVAKKKNTSPVFTAPVDLEPKAKSMVIPDSVSTCSKADRLVKRRRLARSSRSCNKMLNSLSHKVKWVKGPRGESKFSPKRGMFGLCTGIGLLNGMNLLRRISYTTMIWWKCSVTTLRRKVSQLLH